MFKHVHLASRVRECSMPVRELAYIGLLLGHELSALNQFIILHVAHGKPNLGCLTGRGGMLQCDHEK